MKRLGFALILWATVSHADTPEDLIKEVVAAFEPYRGVTLPHEIATALIAAEDKNFLKRDLWRSTITMNAVRVLVPAEHNGAKVRVAFAAAVGLAHTHQTVLGAFAEATYMGNGCYGVTKAAGAYFGKSLDDLSPAEAALIAALFKAPSLFLSSPERHRDRADFVLKTMAEFDGFERFSEGEARLSTLQAANFERNKRCN